MDNAALSEEPATALEIVEDQIVAILHVLSLIVFDLRGVLATFVNRADERITLFDNAIGDAHAVIVLAKCRRTVDNTGTTVVRDVAVTNDAECSLDVVEVIKERDVLLPNKVFTLALGDDLALAALASRERLQERLEHDVLLPRCRVRERDVVVLRVHAEGKVGRECPRGGGPANEACVRVIREREEDVHRRVAHLTVVQLCLEVRERGAATSGEREHLKPAIDEPLVEELLEHPPDGLHVAEIHGLVVVLHVDPAADAPDNVLPFGGVLHDDLSALSVVLRDAHLDYVGSALQTELLIDLELDRQAVSVPTKPAGAVVSSHRRITGHCILHRTSQKMSIMGHARRERGTIVEGVLWKTLGLLKGLLESVDLIPVIEDFFFDFREADFLRNYSFG